MANFKGMEEWYRLVALGMQHGPEAVSAWLKSVAPSEGATDEGLDEDWLEQWYRTMGVVPRSRYLKLLERNEALRRRLEEAEATIERLERQLEARGGIETDTEQMLDVWKRAVEETVKAQEAWLRSFTDRSDADAPDPSGPDETSK